MLVVWPHASTRPPASKPDNGETDRLRKLDEEKLAWDGVDKEDYQDVKHFLDRYPDGFLSFVAKSQLDLLDRTNRATRQAEETNKGAAQDDRLASLQTQESPRESLEQPMTTEMVRSIQTELNRLGCQAGTVDGQWGNNSRKALRKYGDELGIELASTDPSARLLDELRAKSKRVCPLVCGPRYDVSGDQCVLKSCPSGQQLSSKGACYTPSRTATSGSSRSSSGASKPLSSNCFMFNGKKVCE